MLNHLLRCARLIGGLDTASTASGHQAATSAILSGTCANALLIDTLIISLSIDRVRISTETLAVDHVFSLNGVNIPFLSNCLLVRHAATAT